MHHHLLVTIEECPKLAISRIRDCIRSLNYVVSLHAAEELDDDNLTILDLENSLLTGEIVERQRDRQTREVTVNASSVDSHSTGAAPTRSSSLARSETSLSSPSTSPDQLCASCGRPAFNFAKSPAALAAAGHSLS